MRVTSIDGNANVIRDQQSAIFSIILLFFYF